MKEIETEFGYAGHWLKQIWRQGDIAIYERSLKKGKPAHELELVIVKVRPDRQMPNGAIVAAHEAYPGPSEWGTLGWSFPIRYKDPILALAEKLQGITKARAGFVRSAWSQIKAKMS